MAQLLALALLLFASAAQSSHGGQTWWAGEDVVRATKHGTRYDLTVRHRGVTQALVRDSPFPFTPTSVRTADLTHDGRPDLLVTLECDSCNHASAIATVFARHGASYRRIYGWGFLAGDKEGRTGVHGRLIIETPWGARRGLMWFDEPRANYSVCCPAYRLRTFYRWNGRRFRIVRTERVDPDRDDFLGQPPVPAP